MMSTVGLPPAEGRDWYTVKEVSARFGKTPQGIRDAADNGLLHSDVEISAGGRKERRFPKAEIDALGSWPGYGGRPVAGSRDAQLLAELERQRTLNAELHREAGDLRAGRAAAEMRVDELRRTVDRQQRALLGLVQALTDDGVDLDKLKNLLS
jgi:hypothetical protein